MTTTPSTDDRPATPRRSSASFVLLGLVVLLAVGFAVWRSRAGHPDAQPVASGGAPGPAAGARGAPGGPGGAAPRPVSVAVAKVARRDVPVYLTGLGTVSALNTVTVKPQVDGRLDQVLFREGQAVKKGQPLALIDPRPFQIQLQQAQGALARDQAQLKNARLNVERDRQLIAQKLIAQQQLDTDEATLGQLEGAVRVDQAAIATAQLNLEYAHIVAPIEGVTGARQVDAGNIVHASDANGLVLLTQLDPISVFFTLPQDVLASVQREMAREALPVEVYSRDGTTRLGTGTLVLLDNQIVQTTSTLRLKAVVPNPERLLWPNAFVNARLRLRVERGALVVPVTALQRGPSGTYVYVVDGQDNAAPRPVQARLTQGEDALLASGVEAGETVVTDGQNALRPGAKVAPRPAPNGAGRGSGVASSAPPGNGAGRPASGAAPGDGEARSEGTGSGARGGRRATGGTP